MAFGLTSLLIPALVASAFGAPEDVLDPFLRRLYDQAQELEQDGRLEAAAVKYRAVHAGEPTWKQALLDLGRVLERADRVDEALEAYASAPFDPDCVEALGLLQLHLDDHEEAEASFETLAALRPSWPGALVLLADARSWGSPRAAAELVEDYLDYASAELDERLVEVTVRAAEGLRDDGDEPAAEGLLERLERRFPGGEGLDALTVARRAMQVDAQARALAAAGDIALTPEGDAALARARIELADGDHEGALHTLRLLVTSEPRSASSWAALAEALSVTGDFPGAEQAIDAAIRLAPLEATYVARRASFLGVGFGGRYDGEAAETWAAAARSRPGDPELWAGHARTAERAGRPDDARAAWERVLGLHPDAELIVEAEAALGSVSAERLPPVELPDEPGQRPSDVSEGAWLAFHRAWVWRDLGEPERALSQLSVARAGAPAFAPAIALEADIRADRGEVDEALALYERALDAGADSDVMVDMARLLGRAGRLDDREALWEEAAEAGNPRATWIIAVHQTRALRWWAARRTLSRFFAGPSGAVPFAQAQALDRRLSRSIGAVYGLAALTIGTGLAVPLLLRRRRRSGASIVQLVRRAPRTGRDIARICSALRHEVLKHNTSVLPTVADALDGLDPDPAMWAAERLFGADGALAQLDSYVEELNGLGRASGIPLNLTHRDRVFTPMLAAVARLRGLKRELEDGRGPRLADQLRELSEALNGRAYRGLGELIDGLVVLELKPDLLSAIYAAVAAEPAFLEADVPRLELATWPNDRLLLRLYRTDLRDILANLLRNSIEVSIEAGAKVVGIAVDIDEDLITGLERVAIRVRDRSPARLTTERIRSRYISRGLGLAVDLTSRAGGSIHVESDEGFSKAVVVRLPRAEERGEG